MLRWSKISVWAQPIARLLYQWQHDVLAHTPEQVEAQPGPKRSNIV
jgi:hypothetical protein